MAITVDRRTTSSSIAPTAVRGIVGFVVSVVLIITTLWLVPGPAHAIELPPPVTPAEAMPSTYTRVVANGSGQMFQDQIAFNLWVRQQMAAKAAATAGGTAAPAAAAVAEAVPITKTAAFLKTGGGNLLGLAFAAGWMVTDGTLAMYGHTTGSEPMSGTCAQPAWAVATIQTLYPFSAPDCKPAIATPNGDIVPGTSLVYGTINATLAGKINKGGGTVYRCWSGLASGSVPSGFTLVVWQLTGAYNAPVWQSLNAWTPAGVNECSLAYPGANAMDYEAAGGSTYGQLGIRRNSDSVIVAQAETTAGGDPLRTPSCQLTWPGGSVTTVTGTEAQKYQESAGLPVSTFSALCNDGFVSKPGHGPDLLPTEIEIGSIKEGGTYAPIQEQPVPEFSPDEKKGLTPGTSGGLVLQKIVGTTTQSCMTWEVDCAGWWPATSSGTTPSTSTGTYRCTYNGSAVSLAECGIYRYTFDTQTATPTITDPVTGEESPWFAGNPTWQNTAPAATGGGACGAAFSWNPTDWVLNPIKCAFIPSTATLTATTTTITTAWANTFPVQAMAAASAVFAVVPSASGCAGPRVQFDLDWPAEVHFDAEPLNACNPPVSILAWFARVIGAISIMFATAWGVTRRVGAIFNAKGVGPG